MLAASEKLKRPPSFFLMTASVFGLIFIALVPPMQAYDEQNHFFRAYQLSNLNLRSPVIQERSGGARLPGGYLPSNVTDFGNGFLYSVRLDKNDTSQQKITLLKRNIRLYGLKSPNRQNKNAIPFAGSSVYSPVSYMPQIAGIWIGRLAHLPIIGFYYLGRVFALAAYVFLIYKAIKLSPVGKWLMAVAALAPLPLALAGSFSADSMTIALAYLTVGLFLNYAFAKKTISASDIILAAVVSAAVALCKSGLWPLALLFWFIPISKFISAKRYILANVLITGSGITFFGLWYLAVRYAVPYVAVPVGVAASTSGQMKFLEHEPFSFAATLIHQFLGWHYAVDYFRTAVEGLGWGDVSAGVTGYVLILLVLLAALVFTACEKPPEERIRPYQRIGTLGILITLVAVMALSLYLTISAVGAPMINGVQGRYGLPFIPVIIPVVAVAISVYKKKAAAIYNYAWILAPAVLVVQIMTVAAVFTRYY